jgi:hypothetical protein
VSYLTVFVEADEESVEATYYTLLGIRDQKRPMDEVVLIARKRNPGVRKTFLNLFGIHHQASMIEVPNNPEPPLLRGLAKGVWYTRINAGDLLLPHGLDDIREFCEQEDTEEHPAPLLFRADNGNDYHGSALLVQFEPREKEVCKLVESVVLLRNALI